MAQKKKNKERDLWYLKLAGKFVLVTLEGIGALKIKGRVRQEWNNIVKLWDSNEMDHIIKSSNDADGGTNFLAFYKQSLRDAVLNNSFRAWPLIGAAECKTGTSINKYENGFRI